MCVDILHLANALLAYQAATGPALQAAHAVMKRTGGKMNAFLSALPSVGIASMKSREAKELLGTDKVCSRSKMGIRLRCILLVSG